jgi:hypothetical protein
LKENDLNGDMKDPQVIEIKTLMTRMNLQLGSTDMMETYEAFDNKNANKESVAETQYQFIINHSWESHYSKISVLIFVTRLMPLISMILLVLLD